MITDKRIHIVSAPVEVSLGYKNNTVLEFDVHFQVLFVWFDGSSDGIKRLRFPYHFTYRGVKKQNSTAKLKTGLDVMPSSRGSIGLHIRQFFK